MANAARERSSAAQPLDETTEICPPCEDTARGLYDVLGDATPVKRWLAACLWRRLRENQIRNAPLQEEPERFAIPLHALRA